MIIALLFASGMLLVGVLLRVSLRPLRWIFVPASIVGGLIGLAAIQFVQRAGWAETRELVKELSSWPGWLIAIVFACMLLRKPSGSLRKNARRVGREGIVVWIIVFGQTALGLCCTWLLIQPFFDVPTSFGMLIETGFAGGHGTATAMGTVLQSPVIGLEDGLDLGLFMATCGLLLSVLSGVFFVNLAIRRGWTQRRPKQSTDSDTQPLPAGPRPELEPPGNQPTIARGVIRADVLDPLAFQLLIVAMAFGIGWAMQQGVKWSSQQLQASTPMVVADSVEPEDSSTGGSEEKTADDLLREKTSWVATLGDFPLFIYTLLGGMFTRQLFQVLGLGHLIEAHSIERISSIAMEFLIVAAIASLRIEAVQAFAAPLLILLTAAFLWTGFCLLFVSPRLLPREYWFELGILNYGMSTGTTATGFTLLKMIDEKLDSGAAEDYALAAPLSAPFIGGGMLTVGLPLLVLEQVPIAVSALTSVAIVVALYFVGLRLARRSSPQDSDQRPAE